METTNPQQQLIDSFILDIVEAITTLESNATLTHRQRAQAFQQVSSITIYLARRANNDAEEAALRDLCDVCSHPLIPAEWVHLLGGRFCTDCAMATCN